MRGFTLIEAIIYIALLGFIMAGAIGISYQLIQNSSVLDTKNTVQEEGNFVVRKLNWALSGLSATPIISVNGPCDQSLQTTITDGPTVNVRLDPTNHWVEMKQTGGTYERLTTDNVKVTCLEFGSLPGPIPGIAAKTTINGIDFVFQKYARQ